MTTFILNTDLTFLFLVSLRQDSHLATETISDEESVTAYG